MAKKPAEKKKPPRTPAKTRDTRPPKRPGKVPPIVQKYNEMITTVALYERELKKAKNSNSIRFTNGRMTLKPNREGIRVLALEQKVIKIYEGLKEKLNLPYPVELLQWDSLYYKDGNIDIYHRLYLLTKRLRELRAGEEWQIEERELLNAPSRPGQGEGKNKEKEEVKARLKLVSKTQETYWDDQRKEKVTETEFYALWLLAIVPNSTVQSTILHELFKDSKGNADVYLSRLIRGREERKSGLKYHFPEIEPLIASQERVGYYLKLPPEEIELVGNDPEDIEHLVVRLTST